MAIRVEAGRLHFLCRDLAEGDEISGLGERVPDIGGNWYLGSSVTKFEREYLSRTIMAVAS